MPLNKQPIYYVYRYVNPITGRPFYVGKGKANRARRIDQHNVYCIRLAAKHGCRVEYIRKNMIETEAYELESRLIRLYKPYGFCETNILEGGCGGPGLKHTAESKALIGKAALGNKYGCVHKGRSKPPRSEEHKRRLSEARRGKTVNNKPVICIETGVLYESTTQAAKLLGLNQTKISCVARGTRNHTGGLHFKYRGQDAA